MCTIGYTNHRDTTDINKETLITVVNMEDG